MIWNWGIRTEKANLRHHNLYNKIFYKRVQDKSGGEIASKDTWQYRHNDTEESNTAQRQEVPQTSGTGFCYNRSLSVVSQLTFIGYDKL